MNEAALQAWVGAVMGGRVRSFERVGAGASRATFLVRLETSAGSREAVLRVDSGDGPMSGTALDLPRESGVFRALANTPISAPRLIAQSQDGAAILMERARGTDAFALASDSARPAIAASYLRALAGLHQLDTRPMELPGIERPASPADAARPDLALWRRVYRQRAADTDSLVEFAFDWLDDCAPENAQRVSLCHGDAGPGNFLFEDQHVTALLDWEFAHLGDPLDDLAWVAVRAHLLGGFGTWPDNIEVWETASGLRADRHRIEYYRALVLVRMATSCQAALAYTGDRTMETGVYATLLPYLHFLIPQALELAGCTAPELDGFQHDGAAAIDASPLLREHARPLEALEPR